AMVGRGRSTYAGSTGSTGTWYAEDLMPTAADAVGAAPATDWRRPAIFALFAVILPTWQPAGSLKRVGARARASRGRRRRPKSSTPSSAGTRYRRRSVM